MITIIELAKKVVMAWIILFTIMIVGYLILSFFNLLPPDPIIVTPTEPTLSAWVLSGSH